MKTVMRSTAALCLILLAAGCSSGSKSMGLGLGSSSARDDQCRGNRSKCLYNGKYDEGEKDYAEKEAQRLNQAELSRLKGF